MNKGKNKFCSRKCVKEGYKRNLVINSGLFKKGSISPNKGRTLESWVGEERASVIRAKMSVNSIGKAPQLRRLNDDPAILEKRLRSRRFHDEVVLWLSQQLRSAGGRVFILSEYVKEKRIPDAIIFVGNKLIALEVETEKRWKPSHASTEERLGRLNSLCCFFDETKVVFPKLGEKVSEAGPAFLSHVISSERLNPQGVRADSGG
ncbi:MAG: hypothetical protein JRM73_04905 [Nitrososphaerota archaeon]|nr:hypothetical protein [Nitrososphaerota archaeon]